MTRTRMYLGNSLKMYPEIFTMLLQNNTSIVDMFLGYKSFKNDNCIYILFDIAKLKDSKLFFETLKSQEAYVSDFICGDLNKNYHMVVLKIHSVVNIKAFVEGRYTDVYKNPHQFFEANTFNYKVLTKNKELMQKIKKVYNVDEVDQLDSDPILANEIYHDELVISDFKQQIIHA